MQNANAKGPTLSFCILHFAFCILHFALRRKCLSADVSPVLHTFEVNPRRRRVRRLDRISIGRAATDDGQHAAAGSHQAAVASSSTGVEHE
jgi:hypothetical protein